MSLNLRQLAYFQSFFPPHHKFGRIAIFTLLCIYTRRCNWLKGLYGQDASIWTELNSIYIYSIDNLRCLQSAVHVVKIIHTTTNNTAINEVKLKIKSRVESKTKNGF